MHLFWKWPSTQTVFFSSLTEFPVSLTFNHKQIVDWKPTFFFFLFSFLSPFFSLLDSCNSFGTAVSVTGVIQGMAFTVGGVWNQILKWMMAGKKREKKLKIIHWFIIVATYRQWHKFFWDYSCANDNRATTWIEPAIVSRHEQLLGVGVGVGVGLFTNIKRLPFWQYMRPLAFDRKWFACLFCLLSPIRESIFLVLYVATPSLMK